MILEHKFESLISDERLISDIRTFLFNQDMKMSQSLFLVCILSLAIIVSATDLTQGEAHNYGLCMHACTHWMCSVIVISQFCCIMHNLSTGGALIQVGITRMVLLHGSIHDKSRKE